MRSAKTQSVRSVRPIKSVRTTESTADERGVLEFDEYLIMACKKFSCSCPVIIKKKDIFNKSPKNRETVKYKKINIITNSEDDIENVPEKTDQLSGTGNASYVRNSKTIVIDATYDNFNQLYEIGMNKIKNIPRLLMQLLGHVVPHYSRLTKMFIKQCHIDAYTVYELSKMLPLTSITDVCLDGTPVPEGNYELLLNSDCRLNHISLSRCLVNDEVCGQIASKLHYLGSAEATLMTLNLSSNSITDRGAKLLADALRTNRHLRYLNLAGNHITDDGAYSLFESLMEFPLTHDEILNKNMRYMDYLKSKQALLMKYLSEWDSISMNEYSQVSKKSVSKKKNSSATSLKSKQCIGQEKPMLQNATEDTVFLKAQMLAGEVIGPFTDPFSNFYINKKDKYTYCLGNLMLCYLNLAYNNLTFLCLKKLYSVLFHQDSHKKLNQPGLIKVLLDGNYMPNDCTEIFQINEIMSKNIRSYKDRLYGDVGGRRKSRMSRISVLPGTPHTNR